MPRSARSPELPCPNCKKNILQENVGFYTKNQWRHKFVTRDNRLLAISEGTPEHDSPESVQRVYCGLCNCKLPYITMIDLTILPDLSAEYLEKRLEDLRGKINTQRALSAHT